MCQSEHRRRRIKYEKTDTKTGAHALAASRKRLKMAHAPAPDFFAAGARRWHMHWHYAQTPSYIPKPSESWDKESLHNLCPGAGNTKPFSAPTNPPANSQNPHCNRKVKGRAVEEHNPCRHAG